MLGHLPDAEDVAQETFLRFFRALPRFRGQSTLRTYLVRIAINLSFNELRRMNKNLDMLSSSLEEEQVRLKKNSRDTVNRVEQRIIVEQALQKLPAKLRSVLVLRLAGGYSSRETAEILKLPLGTVLSRLHRAQEQLKPIFMDHEEKKSEQKENQAVVPVF